MREINIGERFGRLQVIGLGDKVHEANGSWSCRYLCRCDCGTVKQIRARALLQPKNPTRSCGCLRLSRIHEQKTLHGESGGRFVGKRTQLYRCWSNIKSRCYNHNVRSYADYGAKGIIMCDEWLHDFFAFATWAKTHGFKEGLTINRKNPAKNYEPSNCEWITLSENSKQTRHHHLCEGHNLETGEVVQFWHIREFAAERGLSYSCIDQVLHGHNKTHKNWTFRYVK